MRSMLMLGTLIAAPAIAQRVDVPATEQATEVLARKVPVTAGDIVDRPYRVVARVDMLVTVNVFQKAPSDAKVHKELWERASRMGADAVVNAQYGITQRGMIASWGARASGDAVKFLTSAETEAYKRRLSTK